MNSRTHTKKTRYFCALLFLVAALGYGQYSIRSQEEIKRFERIPRETVFLHYNNSLFLVGEYLYYKMYCLQGKDLSPSGISKIGYVELVDKDRNLIFEHKLLLVSGMGQGDFFIPTTVPSGNYKLIGYTRWMLNNSENRFFSANITIVNPYDQLPKTTLSQEKGESKPVPDTEESGIGAPSSKKGSASGVHLESDKVLYGKRERVSLKIKNTSDLPVGGNYSISVRKKYMPKGQSPITATHFFNESLKDSGHEKFVEGPIYLPELRGELICGSVLSKTNSVPLARQVLGITFLGENPLAYILRTNKQGLFYCNLGPSNRKSTTILQVLGENRSQGHIVLHPLPKPSYADLEFKALAIPPDSNPSLLQRSIYNQVENAFLQQKADSMVQIDFPLPVYHKLSETYILDDYKRFKTLKETVTEIIKGGVILRKVKGKEKLFIRDKENYFLNPENAPLVLVDGIILEDISELIAYDIRGVKDIGISRHDYFIGPKRYKGMVSVHTKNQDFVPSTGGNRMQRIQIPSPVTTKVYRFQDYAQKTQLERIPDYRHQLFWDPDIVLEKKETSLVFYTSDNVGEYEIVLEGFTAQGRAISVSKAIQVH
ncbi:MAG: hypothetical protein AAFX53_02595 [Bacteroidota bacterium]